MAQSQDSAFAIIERAAAAGARCPTADQGLQTATVSALARAGKIKVQIYALNWRVVTVLVGDHKGKKTAPCPHKNNGPYLTCEAAGTFRRDGTEISNRAKAEREARLKLRPYAGAEPERRRVAEIFSDHLKGDKNG